MDANWLFIRNKFWKIFLENNYFRSAQTECKQTKSTSKELEKSLEERQWQLQQRANQVSIFLH